MKALSLQQPWATLMAIGAKRIETRAWPMRYRGPLAIHASARWNTDVLELLTLSLKPPICDGDSDWRRMIAALVRAGYATLGEIPLGKVLCTVNVVDCIETANIFVAFDSGPSEDELAFGDYRAGRYAILTENLCRLSSPVAAKGRLGLWDWVPDHES